MSAPAIRAALETALDDMSPSLPTAWENTPYEPTVGTAHQLVSLLYADARALEISGKWHEEPGLMQVTLRYPKNAGPAAAETRAELIRSTFRHGSEFTASGVTVTVSNVPSITPLPEEDWHTIAVRVPFYSFIRRT